MHIEQHDGKTELHLTQEDFWMLGGKILAEEAEGVEYVEFVGDGSPDGQKAGEDEFVVPIDVVGGKGRFLLDGLKPPA
jgi:hypothetical protein